MKSPSERKLIAEYWQVICYVDGERRGPVCDKTAVLWTTQFGSRGAARFRARALRQGSTKTITYKVVHIRRYRVAKL
jgi:hypothetical protein